MGTDASTDVEPSSPVARVRIAVTTGAAGDSEHVYERRTTALVGRAGDCNLRLPPGDVQVSRHHCLLDINPPDVRIRDFGSLNGTFVNDVEIGRRAANQTREEGSRVQRTEHDLRDGDEVRLGRTRLRVSITSPPVVDTRPSSRCVKCGSSAAAEVVPGGVRGGPVLCHRCSTTPQAVVAPLRGQAEQGDGDESTLSGYQLVREVGRGAQGAVYLARKWPNSEFVAVKTLLASVAVQPRAQAEFLREIAAMNALDHVNVVRLLDHGVSGSTFWFASEYCSGGNATLLAGPDGLVAPEIAVPLILQVLDGLAHAHGCGLVHRDIKPSNILLADAGGRRVAKLGDFGLAKAFDNAGLSGHTRSGAVAGTVAFMARAQLLDYRFAKPSVDVWAVAATLYKLLTGQLPRDFDDDVDPIIVVLRRPAVPVRTRLPTLPVGLAEVLDAALVEGPSAQIVTADALAAALRAELR